MTEDLIEVQENKGDVGSNGKARKYKQVSGLHSILGILRSRRYESFKKSGTFMQSVPGVITYKIGAMG